MKRARLLCTSILYKTTGFIGRTRKRKLQKAVVGAGWFLFLLAGISF